VESSNKPSDAAIVELRNFTRISPVPAPARALRFSVGEWRRLAGLYGVVGLLHALGWGLFLHYAARYPALVGLGFTAYMFGLRHAFDADHIAAVDDTVRYLAQRGQRPLGVGFFFSLGHSTVVFLLALGLIFLTNATKTYMPGLREIGGLIGAGVSGVFLCTIGALNLFSLLAILKIWRGAGSGQHSHAHLEQLLANRGLLNRLFGGRLPTLIRSSWQMYPLGLLFGLGFDTASEIGLLAMTATASVADLPAAAVLSLPLLFAAGMTAMDTTDGVLMVKVYDWARSNPARKIFYNLTTTGLSVAVALLIGTIELLQVFISVAELDGSFSRYIAGLDFGSLGYVVVGLFLSAWVGSIALWKFGRYEQRYGGQLAVHAHDHTHADGSRHSHPHPHLE
jgi:nickel/cobalt transporter (NiCoT) family protein